VWLSNGCIGTFHQRGVPEGMYPTVVSAMKYATGRHQARKDRPVPAPRNASEDDNRTARVVISICGQEVEIMAVTAAANAQEPSVMTSGCSLRMSAGLLVINESSCGPPRFGQVVAVKMPSPVRAAMFSGVLDEPSQVAMTRDVCVLRTSKTPSTPAPQANVSPW